MKKWKVFAGVSAVFLSGIVVGVFGTAVVVKQRIEEWQSGNYQVIADRAVRKLDRKLHLTDEQEQGIHPILLETYQSLFRLRNGIRPEALEVVHSGMKQISEHLTDSQAENLHRLIRFPASNPSVIPTSSDTITQSK